MHTDPNTMTAWELAYALTEIAERSHHHDAAILRAAVRRLSVDAESTGEPGFIPGHRTHEDPATLSPGHAQSDPPFHPMVGAAPSAYRADPARVVEDGAQ